jgi:hypothetical protein
MSEYEGGTEEFEDYFSYVNEFKYVFPDGKQYITFAAMSEGMRAKYQAATRQDIRVDAKTRDVRLNPNPTADRHALILMSAVDYRLSRRGQIVTYDPRKVDLKDLLELANPKLIDEIERVVRDNNPWLTSDISVEDIDAEISRLNDLREAAVVREREGEAS